MHACTLLVWHVLYLFVSPNIDIVILILMQCPQAGFIERCAVTDIWLIRIQVFSSHQFDWVT